MQAYIPTREDLKEIVKEAVRETVDQSLPGAIRKATRRKWLTTEETAKMLQVSPRQVQYLRSTNQIPYSQSGRTIRHDIEDVEEFLNSHKVGKKK